ncbi:Uncharacterized protein TCM_022146 [Theobroma cacao]|uniref:Uncharacterized protein n=1 Tax=Theobroma cacao TaxID=3641 RepID=A0A061EZZ0_THECC|nr:Uncharacterized protein TCM_022146 [Theobroma cacao]
MATQAPNSTPTADGTKTPNPTLLLKRYINSLFSLLLVFRFPPSITTVPPPLYTRFLGFGVGMLHYPARREFFASSRVREVPGKVSCFSVSFGTYLQCAIKVKKNGKETGRALHRGKNQRGHLEGNDAGNDAEETSETEKPEETSAVDVKERLKK